MMPPSNFPRARLLAAALVAAALASSPAAAQGAPAPGAARADTLRLSLDEAVTLALRTSDEARLAEAQVDVADAQLTVARASALPQLRLNSTYNRALKNARAQVAGAAFNQPETYNVSLGLTQTVFQGGRIRAASRAASSIRSAARLNVEEARAAVSLDVQRAYLEALLTGRVVEIQQENLTLASARLRQVEQFQGAGRAARYDVLRARVERANIEPALIQARNDREIALLELKRLANIPIDQPLALTTVVDPDAATAALASFQDSVTAIDRASIRAAELEARAEREGVRIARADYWPTVNLSFTNGYQAFPPRGFGFPTTFGRLATQFCPTGSAVGRECQNGGWFQDQAVGMTVSWPLFDGFRTRANVALAQAQVRIADVQLQLEREAVAVEVARARAELLRARAAYGTQRQNVSEASEAFQLATLRFNRGLSTQLEVSDAQVALLTAQVNQARATYDLYLAAAELARSLGRPIPVPGSTPAPATPRPSDDRGN